MVVDHSQMQDAVLQARWEALEDMELVGGTEMEEQSSAAKAFHAKFRWRHLVVEGTDDECAHDAFDFNNSHNDAAVTMVRDFYSSPPSVGQMMELARRCHKPGKKGIEPEDEPKWCHEPIEDVEVHLTTSRADSDTQVEVGASLQSWLQLLIRPFMLCRSQP